MKTKILAGMAMFVGVCAMTTSASADPPKNNDVEYKFTDEKLLGDTMGALGAQIPVRPMGRRDRLHRIRTQFVAEMLKSVENM